jgi:DHA2 family multidrug resistance protein
LLIAFGFFSMGCALTWAYFEITPNLDFTTMTLVRATQTFALAFLFVPTSTIAYATLPKEQNADASALYVMFRNIAGSIAISLATAFVRDQSQVHRGLLVHNMTDLNRGFQQTLQSVQQTMLQLGRPPGSVHQEALGWMNQTLNAQASFLAYMDIFAVCAVAAFLVVPVCFLFAPTKGGGGAPAH